MIEGIGFYCGIVMRWFRDAFCELEQEQAARDGVDVYDAARAQGGRAAAGLERRLRDLLEPHAGEPLGARVARLPRFRRRQPGRTPAASSASARSRRAPPTSRAATCGIVEELAGIEVAEAVLTGGAAKGTLWPQIVADVLGVPVRVPAVKESTALGAAIYAGVGAGLYDDAGAAARTARPLRADVRARRGGGATRTPTLYERWLEIYRRSLELSEAGSCARSGARPGHERKGTAMPEADSRDDKQFHEDIPAPDQGFFLKGSGAYDWGMKNRLARIFRPDTGKTVMLAIDHGYFQGPTTGLERVDLNIVPIAPYADALMLTRGMLRSTIPRDAPRRHRDARERRPEHPQGSLQRADRARHGGRGADERARRRGTGLRRRRVRDAVGREHDDARRRRLPLRHPGARRDRGRQGADARRPLPRARDADLRRARRAVREDVLLSPRASRR